jgi:cobalt-zinc-cadmium efflux system outer membrane protein
MMPLYISIKSKLAWALLSLLLADPARGGWSLEEVQQQALSHRQEIGAADARLRAAEQRPATVSALEDPMLMPSIDHYPFEKAGEMEERNGSFDWSLAVEQRFPLSRLRSHRREVAEAEVAMARSNSDKTVQEIALQAASAFFMVAEKRRMAEIAQEQITLARQWVATATSRYESGRGSSADILRSEVELARLAATRQALEAEIRSAEAMLNASMGRNPAEPLPALLPVLFPATLPDHNEVLSAAQQQRPELQAGSAEIARARAETAVMRSMNAPMGLVRLGYASTMAEGDGAMVMFGVSLPIWQGRNRSSLSEAVAMEQMAESDLAAMQQMAAGEASAALGELEAAHIHYRMLQEEVIPRTERLLAPALAAYASGQGALADVIESNRALRTAETEVAMAHTRLGLAWARLYRVTGTSTLERSP